MTFIRRFGGSDPEKKTISHFCFHLWAASSYLRQNTFNSEAVDEVLECAKVDPDKFPFWISFCNGKPSGFIGFAVTTGLITTENRALDLGFWTEPDSNHDAATFLLAHALEYFSKEKIDVSLSSSTGIRPKVYGRWLRRFGFEETGRTWSLQS